MLGRPDTESQTLEWPAMTSAKLELRGPPGAPWYVDLEPGEAALAAMVGGLRQAYAMGAKLRDGYDAPMPTASHIRGAGAELAIAKATNLYWGGTVGQIGVPDVGLLEVKSRPKDSERMWIEPKNPTEAWYVLVVGTVPRFRIAGCIHGTKAKIDRWKQTTPQGICYVVPQLALTPCDRATLRQYAGEP